MLADAAGDHIMRSGQHANHGDVDREAPVQIKAVSVRRHSRAPAKRALSFCRRLPLLPYSPLVVCSPRKPPPLRLRPRARGKVQLCP